MLHSAEAAFNFVIKALMVLVAISIAFFAVMIPVNLLLIKMQWGAIWWLHEAIEYALYVGVFLGAPAVLQQGAHVRVDFITANLSPSTSAKLERFVDAVGAIICAVLCIYGIRAALWEFEDGTLPDKDLRIANWIMLMVFSASFLMLTIEFLFRFRRADTIVTEESQDPTKAAF